MARKPKEIVGLTLRVREDLRRRLEREAKKYGMSLNAQIERRLEDSFELANTASLIRVLAGGGFNADLLGAIATMLNSVGYLHWHPETSLAARVRMEAAYIALIIIFTKLFSTPDRLLDPGAAGEVIATERGRGSLEATICQMEGAIMANNVLNKLEHVSLLQPTELEAKHGLIPTDADLLRPGLLKFPNKKEGKTK
jgi:hypothetical protein